MNATAKTVVFWAVIIVAAFFLWQAVKNNAADQPIPEISYSDFRTRISDGQVRTVTIAGNVVRFRDSNGSAFRVIVPVANQSAMVEALQQKGSDIRFQEAPEGNWTTWLMNLAPLLLLAALWFYMIRYMRRAARMRPGQGGGGPDGSSQGNSGS